MKPQPNQTIFLHCGNLAKRMIENGKGHPYNHVLYADLQSYIYRYDLDMWEHFRFDFDKIPEKEVKSKLTRKEERPQLSTAEIPLLSGTENTPVTADIPLTEVESNHDQATVFTPLPIIQISRANICKLKTCFNEIPETRKDYCSDSCRIKFHNQNRSKKTA
jgi:hypothetical protein